jgi:hypothetical protein
MIYKYENYGDKCHHYEYGIPASKQSKCGSIIGDIAYIEQTFYHHDARAKIHSALNQEFSELVESHDTRGYQH